MSDDLVKKLRMIHEWKVGNAAADRTSTEGEG
jgi:hypothetical protein